MLRGGPRRIRRSRNRQRRAILQHGQVPFPFYIVHSSEINMRPGKIPRIRLRARAGERILRGCDHLGKELARLVRLALKSGSHGQPIGGALVIRMRRQYSFEGRRGRRRAAGADLDR